MQQSTAINFNKCIFAAKDRSGQYKPDELVTDLQRFYEGLEYADTAAGTYQLWDYPSGKIYNIVPDRESPSANSTPYGPNGIVWQPTLKYVKTDPDYVQKLSESYLKKWHSDK